MKLTVGILNWNTSDILDRSLCVLNDELNDIEHEVIIVDQGSVDNILDVYSDWVDRWNESGELVLIKNDVNVGISRGKNQCIDIAKGEYLLLLDGDLIPVPNSIKLMIQWMDENEDKYAIGMYPNRWTNQENKNGQKFYEEKCDNLFNPTEHNGACLFYGMYRRNIFDDGLRMYDEDEFANEGYGWEDHDFFYQMKDRGIKQYVAHINNPQGHYFHRINSSLKNDNCIPKGTYRDIYAKRKALFDKRWKDGS